MFKDGQNGGGFLQCVSDTLGLRNVNVTRYSIRKHIFSIQLGIYELYDYICT